MTINESHLKRNSTKSLMASSLSQQHSKYNTFGTRSKNVNALKNRFDVMTSSGAERRKKRDSKLSRIKRICGYGVETSESFFAVSNAQSEVILKKLILPTGGEVVGLGSG